jgi:aldehyde dehydrogenase (NAD+)
VNVHEELLVAGEWRKPASQARIDVVCPSTEEVIGQVPEAGAEDVDMAVRAARSAFDQGVWWRAMSLSEQLSHAADRRRHWRRRPLLGSIGGGHF